MFAITVFIILSLCYIGAVYLSLKRNAYLANESVEQTFRRVPKWVFYADLAVIIAISLSVGALM
jgi:hypothetical protein